MTMNYVGIDIGGTSIKYGLVNANGDVHEKSSCQTPKTHPELVAEVVKIITAFQTRRPLAGVGICMPGVIKSDGTLVTAGALFDSYGKNLLTAVQQNISLPVLVENDANAATLAEQWLGAARNSSNYVSLILGTGVGGGVVVNDQLIRGTHGLAGELGWFITQKPDSTGALNKELFNEQASVIGGLCQTYNEQAGESESDARDIFLLAQAGDALAQTTLQQYYDNLSVGIVDLMVAYDPQCVVIGGAISTNTEFMSHLRVAVAKLVSRHPSLVKALAGDAVLLYPAKLGNDAGMIGAVYQLMQRQKK